MGVDKTYAVREKHNGENIIIDHEREEEHFYAQFTPKRPDG
jgi:hypothetical protein